jgi:signal transduction histidine kinase
MPDSAANPELRRAYVDYERELVIEKCRVACLLGVVFMPGGVALDLFVYRENVPGFLAMRMLTAFLLGVLWWLFSTSFGRKHYKTLGMIEVCLPMACISWMIYMTQGATSPYYAGLNLVLMGAGIVLRWTLFESTLALVFGLGMYLLACYGHGKIDDGATFFNNIYFLVVTGVFAMAGNYLYSKTRFREFELRYQVDAQKRQIEEKKELLELSNHDLEDKKTLLEKSYHELEDKKALLESTNDKLAEQKALIEESHQKLVELDQVKSRFFANISHELRTPLTLLIAPLERIRQEMSQHDPMLRDLLDTMQANGMRLLKLINDLLDLVRLESGQMLVKRDPVAIEPFLLGLAQSVRQVAQDKHLRIETRVEEIDELFTDRDKLEKISLNLLFNAIKFTPAGGVVKLVARRDENFWVLEIIDTGMGITPENLPNVFRRFWQADTSSQRKYQGAGIGLALVKELVEVQGGAVSVSSIVGKGTTMTARLPYEPTEGADPAVELPTEADRAEVPAVPGLGQEWLSNLYRRAEFFPSLTSLRDSMRPVEILSGGNRPVVLIADDEPDMLRFLKTQLQRDCQILEAVDGQQAVEKALQFMPDVILLDMMMPEKDGLQACRELREKTPTQRIPIVLLTARADEETKLAALEAGASDFLTKPFSTTELSVRIRNLIEARTFERKLARQNQILEATLQQLKDTEMQLVQTEKLASLGRMSAGIIHEINNPLNFAKTAIYTLKQMGKSMPEEERPDYEEILKDIQDGVDRVRMIVSDLRSFTHPNLVDFQEVKIEKVFTASLRFVSNEWRDKVELQKHIDEDLTVWGNEHQLIQVIVNLMQNAFDALRKKEFKDGEKPLVIIDARMQGSQAIVRIRDNGMGISSDNVGKIFDPFFTTKDVGEGMGLGLSICYRIIQAHEGRIVVNSVPTQYCEFTLELPATRQETETETESEAAPALTV